MIESLIAATESKGRGDDPNAQRLRAVERKVEIALQQIKNSGSP